MLGFRVLGFRVLGFMALLFVLRLIWGFPKIRGTFLGAPLIRTIVFWRLYWGTPIWGNYHMNCSLNS